MMIRTVRNIICRRLHDFLGQPVLLHDQAAPGTRPPMVYYQPVSALIPLGGASIGQDGGMQYRREPAEATISITAVSYDRDGRDGRIYGDDEALELAERAMSWMLHIGRRELLLDGIAVVEVGNVQCRSNLMIDEVARQYGFDVRVRFDRTTTIDIPIIADGSITEI